MIKKEDLNRLKRMLHSTRLTRSDFFHKVYSRRWQNLLSTAKGISLYNDRNNLPVAEVICNAEYPFTVRGGYNCFWTYERRHYPYYVNCYNKTLCLPGGITCRLNINDDGKIHNIGIVWNQPHICLSLSTAIDARGWSEAQLIRLFTELPLAVSHWKEEDDYINMEFDKIEKIRAIRKNVAQIKKKREEQSHG